ncbi:unnamed protein product [Hermetia illucens]|uniref:Uncharacterized protein n=1 Tax=Hermetia illucens TaxID=343691 RepID=A0A7R8YVB1_HERIL|nr:unnamed protein product [Hermetia illucens]
MSSKKWLIDFFCSVQNAKISILIRGELKQIQGVQALAIDGSYNKTDTGFAVQVFPYKLSHFCSVPVGIPPKVIATIVG